QDELPGVVDEPAGDAQQAVPQGGDHGFAVADTQPGQRFGGAGVAGGVGVFGVAVLGGGAGGDELVEPAGDAGGNECAPHPGGIDLDVAGGEVTPRGTVFAVAEDVPGSRCGAGTSALPRLPGPGWRRRGW